MASTRHTLDAVDRQVDQIGREIAAIQSLRVRCWRPRSPGGWRRRIPRTSRLQCFLSGSPPRRQPSRAPEGKSVSADPKALVQRLWDFLRRSA